MKVDETVDILCTSPCLSVGSDEPMANSLYGMSIFVYSGWMRLLTFLLNDEEKLGERDF